MAIAFRLNSDGMVDVLIKPFSKKIVKEDFLESYQKMDFLSFVYRFKDEKVIESLKLDMEKLQRIDKLTMNGPKLEVGKDGKLVVAGCYIGKLYFEKFFTDSLFKQKGIQYGYGVYGKEKMKKIVDSGVFNPPVGDFQDSPSLDYYVHYYFDGQEIDKDMYLLLKDVRDDFSRIRDFENPLDKTDSIIDKKINKR